LVEVLVHPTGERFGMVIERATEFVDDSRYGSISIPEFEEVVENEFGVHGRDPGHDLLHGVLAEAGAGDER